MVPGDHRQSGWLNMLYDTDTIHMTFHHQSRLDRWDEERQDGIEKRGSEENWARVLRTTYVDEKETATALIITAERSCGGMLISILLLTVSAALKWKKNRRREWEHPAAPGKRDWLQTRQVPFLYMASMNSNI